MAFAISSTGSAYGAYQVSQQNSSAMANHAVSQGTSAGVGAAPKDRGKHSQFQYHGAQVAQTDQKNAKMKKMLRALDEKSNAAQYLTGEEKRKMNFAYTATLADKQSGFLDTRNTKNKTTEEEKTPVSVYNYKDVSNLIQRAKTSVAAGQAVIKARRQIMDLKRKIAAGKGDPQELSLALTHAKRMERVAKKKQHNLELEELVERKQKGETVEEGEKSSGLQADIYEAEHEKISDVQYKLEEEQQKALDSFIEEHGLSEIVGDAQGGLENFTTDILPEEILSEDLTGDVEAAEILSPEVLEDMQKLMDEFGSMEGEMLEQLQEQLSLMETVDPKMSEEDLKELKMKHRQSERKDIVKADMAYLKSYIEYQEKKEARLEAMAAMQMKGVPQAALAGGMSNAVFSANQAVVPVSMPGGEGAVPVSVDISV